MAVFVDTSAIYAQLDTSDPSSARAAEAWARLLEHEELVTHNYVLVEAAAVLQSRLGVAAVRDLHDELVPVLGVHWIDQELHDDAVREVVASGSRAISFVDRVSFRVMRMLGVSRAFAYDPHFRDEGFELVG